MSSWRVWVYGLHTRYFLMITLKKIKMKTEVNNIIDEFFSFSGAKSVEDFKNFIQRVDRIVLANLHDPESAIKLEFIRQKLHKGLHQAELNRILYDADSNVKLTVNEYDMERFYQKSKKKDLGKIVPKKDKNLGKLVDEGEVPYQGSRADQFWQGKMKVVFDPYNKQIRSGPEMPKTYDYGDIDYIKEYYNLKGIEFGNWLSQQDRNNYMSGLGISLFDLHRALAFNPKQISLKGKITVAFGARGRGNATGHFEPGTFAINLTRYKRPKKGSTLQKKFDRTKLLIQSGGVGTFAHEFGHALDFFGGTFLEKTPSKSLSGGRSQKLTSNKQELKANSLKGLMARLLDKIIWQVSNKKHSTYFERFMKAKKRYKLTGYYTRRAEIFARAFESYVHYKMQQRRAKNIFLAESKYDLDLYMSPAEIRKIESTFDALVSGIKKRI